MKFISCFAKAERALVPVGGIALAAAALIFAVDIAPALGQTSGADLAAVQCGQPSSPLPVCAQVASLSTVPASAAEAEAIAGLELRLDLYGLEGVGLPRPSGPSMSEMQQHSTSSDARRAEAERELKREEQQRMLAVVPDFYSVRSGQAVPLSPGQKFRLALADIFDPFDVSASAMEAGLEQQQGEFQEYGSGWTGYAKRFGAAYADDADGELLSEGVFPSALHQDPRYFRLGRGTISRRIVYSLFSAVRCRGDNGRWQFNTSGIVGTFAAGAISNAYYPPADRGLGLTLQRGSIDIGENLLQSLASEFYPDVSRALFHRHPKGASSSDLR